MYTQNLLPLRRGLQTVLFLFFVGHSALAQTESCPTPNFATAKTYGTDEYVLSVVAADFNGDKILDLASSNQDGETISVLLGNGDGTFKPAINYTSGRNPQGLAVGDFNGDSRPDLAVANNFGNGTISILIGNGDGTFGSPSAFSVGSGVAPTEVRAGDFNGDGRADLVAINRTGQSAARVSILLGNGNGTFAAPVIIDLGMVGDGSDVSIGDVNGDGKLDIVATTRGALAVLPGNGDGTFQTPLVEQQPPLFSPILSDLNADGKPDLVLGGNDLRVRLGNGNGTFGAPQTLIENGTTDVAVSDVNRDNIPDVVVTFFPGYIGILLGRGDGTFAPIQTFGSSSDTPGSIATGDFNGDNRIDLAVANSEYANVGVLLNECNGSLPSVTRFVLVNASTDKDIMELNEGDVIDASLLPRATLTIRANTAPAEVGSVFFELSGGMKFRHTENGAPYALNSDNKGDFFGIGLQAGDYTLTATPYNKKDRMGVQGAPLTLHFTIFYPAFVTSFTLVNAENGKDIMDINEGDVLNLASLPTQKLNIRANADPGTVGSVAFDLSGQQTHRQIENQLPYALYGGDNLYNGWTPAEGSYTLTATPYSAPKADGTVGTAHTVGFSVVNTAPSITAINNMVTSSSIKDMDLERTKLNASPNPFANMTRLQYSMPVPASVNIKVYDVLGREISTLFKGQQKAGTYNIEYNTGKLSPGVYYCRMVATAAGKELVQMLKLVKAE